LAGFTDGESGGFYSSIIKRKNTSRLLTQFKLKIVQVLPNNVDGELAGSAYFSICSKLSEFLKTALISKTIRLNNIKFIFTIIVHSSASQYIIMMYFDKFPLLGVKSSDYTSWREARLKYLNQQTQKDFFNHK
jgi:hypothetical protein